MGNKVLGKRSRSFYKGFNEKQIQYLKDKFESLSEKGVLHLERFKAAYKINDLMAQAFLAETNFDDTDGVDQYEFICQVSAICNMSIQQMARMLFRMATSKSKKKQLTPPELHNFTALCLSYNGYLQSKEVSAEEIKKQNLSKFKKYDVDKNKSIDENEFVEICMKDLDYKTWLYNMGFITKKQLEFQDQIYDLVDSDIGEEVDKHLAQNNPNVDRLKRGIQNRINDDEFQTTADQGDQSIKIEQPWVKTINSLEKNDLGYKNITMNAPSQNLKLNSVLGYRSFDCRNNLKLDGQQNIVYHQSALGIVMTETKGSFSQTFINQHKDDISCLDVLGNTVVTGEVGTTPMIIQWETTDLDQQGMIKSSRIITKELSQSVGNLCLWANTNKKEKALKYLAATCNDADHKLVIYDFDDLKEIEKNITSAKTGVIAKGPLTKHVIFDIKFAIDGKTLAVATIKDLLFVTFQKGAINSSRGDFKDFSNAIPLSLLALKNNKKEYMLSGMTNGAVYFWEKQICVKAVFGHTGSVSALSLRMDCESFVSGDKTGRVIIWSDKFQKRELEIPKNCVNKMVVSLSCSRQKLLIGTKSSDILLLNLNEGTQKIKVVMRGHHEGNLNALALDKHEPYIYTGGDDRRLIKWSLKEKNYVKECKCLYKPKSMDTATNKNDKLLLIGYTNGVIEIYDTDLNKKEELSYKEVKHPDQNVLDFVKFGENNKYFAASYQWPKSCIKLFDLTDKKITFKCQIVFDMKLQEKVLSFDLSQNKNNARYLKTNLQGFENEKEKKKTFKYKLFDISTEKPAQIKKMDDKSFYQIGWITHTCAFSPETKAALSETVSESDITCCSYDFSRRNCFILGDKYSKLKLYNYPSFNNKIFNKYEGHSNAVTDVQFFTKNFDLKDPNKENYVVSIGGEEKAIMIWEYTPVPTDQQYEFNDTESDGLATNDPYALKKDKGEQSMATKAFAGNIKAPTDFLPNSKRDNQLPEENLTIHHAFGIRNKYLADQVRNQCKFSQDSKHVLFPTACMTIKMNIKSKDQSIYREHKEDIVSFAIDSKREIMATGQMAEKVEKSKKKILAIYVWDIESKQVLQKLDGFHTIAVVLLAFSPNSKLLFTCGNDEKNSYAVYDWRSGSIIYSGPISKGKVNGICWKSDTEFMTVGNDHVKFWEKNKGTQGKIQPKSESIICCTNSNDRYITGSAKGNLFYWSGSTSSKPIQAHKGKVQCLFEKKDFIFSGGDDGLIFRWRKSNDGNVKEKELYVDTRDAFNSYKIKPMEQQYGVLSIDFTSQKSEEMVFALRGCYAIHLRNKKQYQIITEGHYEGELWGLGANLKSNVIATAGDDKIVRLLDLDRKVQITRANFEERVRGLDWSSDGKKIIIADVTANIFLYDQNLEFLDSFMGEPGKKNKGDNACFVEEIKFSPNCEYVAYGTHGKSLIFEFLKFNGKKIQSHKVCQSGSSAMLHIDWDQDSRVISFNTQAYQLKFKNINGNDQFATANRNTKWATWTQKIGWPVQGIFQGVDYTDVNTVCRQPNKKWMAVGYDDQTIRLFKYPCYIPKQVSKTFYGHSSHVTKIKFTQDYLVSVGGEDKTIIVWNIEKIREESDEERDLGEESDGLDDLDAEMDLPKKATQRKPKKVQLKEFVEVQDEGDQFMAVKPWLGAIKEPTYKFPKQTDAPPKSQISLEYVHGYRVKDCRQNLFFHANKKSNQVIFHAAAVLIFHNTLENTQILKTDHNDDILSIDYHKGEDTVLTGELGPKPIVNCYKKGELVGTIMAPVKKGVLALAISPDATRAVCAGMDDDHEISLIDLKTFTVIKTNKGGKKVILKLGWVNEKEFVSIGVKHYKYWTISGNNFTGKDGKTSDNSLNFVSLAIKNNLILTGGSGGKIHSWSGSSAKSAIQLIVSSVKVANEEDSQKYPSVVECITISDKFIAAGTKDGYIFFLDENLKQIRGQEMALNLKEKLKNRMLKSQNCGVKSLDFQDNRMLIGTLGSEIYEITFKSVEELLSTDLKINEKNAKLHLKCHYSPNNTWTNEVWGLAIEGDLIFSCSDDATVRGWSLKDRKLLVCASTNVDSKNRQLAMDAKTNDFSESGKARSVGVCRLQEEEGKNKNTIRMLVVVGSKDGTVRTYQYKEERDQDQSEYKLQFKQLIKHATEWVSEIKFAHNMVILGSHDNGIYVYDIDPEDKERKITKKYKPMKKHSSYITHLDVSRDSCYLQSTCGAYQLLFWDLATGKQMTSGASMLKDERWASWTCNLGWPVQGIYPKFTDGTFIHSVDRSNLSIKGRTYKEDAETPFILAAGNNNGKVCLYNYPCTIKNSRFVEGKGHSSHITNVRWNEDDNFIVSVGGEDQCLMHWKVKK